MYFYTYRKSPPMRLTHQSHILRICPFSGWGQLVVHTKETSSPKKRMFRYFLGVRNKNAHKCLVQRDYYCCSRDNTIILSCFVGCRLSSSILIECCVCVHVTTTTNSSSVTVTTRLKPSSMLIFHQQVVKKVLGGNYTAVVVGRMMMLMMMGGTKNVRSSQLK